MKLGKATKVLIFGVLCLAVWNFVQADKHLENTSGGA